MGSLHQQRGWIVEHGEAVVVATEGRDASQGLKILPSNPAGTVSLSMALPVENPDGGGTVLYSDVRVRPAADDRAGPEFYGTRFSVSGDGQAQDWIRLSLRQDFKAGVWDLFIKGAIFRANLGFRHDPESAAPPQALFVFTGHVVSVGWDGIIYDRGLRSNRTVSALNGIAIGEKLPA